MMRPKARALAVGNPALWRAVSLPLLAAAVLALAPHIARAAAFTAKDSDAVGVWAGDPKDSGSRYEVVAGEHAGELKLLPPSAQKMEPIALHRVGPGRFVSVEGVQPDASLTLTSDKHARLRVHNRTKSGIGFTYLLVDKQ